MGRGFGREIYEVTSEIEYTGYDIPLPITVNENIPSILHIS